MTTDLRRIFGGLDEHSLSRLASRRETLRSGGRLAAAFALGSIPVSLAATASKAFASSSLPGPVVDVLNFALALEYLKETFYKRGRIPDCQDRDRSLR